MITREQVADLQPGDVVELRHRLFPEITLRGPVSVSGAREYDLVLPPVWVRERSGEPAEDMEMWATLTVVSRAPRPLYVNHPRTEPWAGDIARDGDGDAWRYWDIGWCIADKASRNPAEGDIRQYGPLRLLWDGQTGQVVP